MNQDGADPDTTIDVVFSLDAATAAHARAVLDGALEPEERDDRFDRWPRAGSSSAATPAGFVAALASAEGAPVGFLGGSDGPERLQLDAIVARPPTATSEWEVGLLDAMAHELASHLGDERASAGVEVWAKPFRPTHAALTSSLGMIDLRSLHQMRCTLPVDTEPVPTRAYEADDFDALLTINNRSFAGHPDQGAQTSDSLAATMSESWFRPDGLRLYERDNRLAGFCWTKIHPSPPANTELGEIYVIGVDPDFHGQGLGVPMTAAGLAWLADQGIDTGMLYVEADNVPAIKTYERLGFSVFRTDRAWLWSPS
jgi:mycothiol synthase